MRTPTPNSYSEPLVNSKLGKNRERTACAPPAAVHSSEAVCLCLEPSGVALKLQKATSGCVTFAAISWVSARPDHSSRKRYECAWARTFIDAEKR